MYFFIVNPHSRSGRGKAVWDSVEAVLKKEKVVYQVFFTKYRYHAAELAREITSRQEALTLVAVGGDGTVNEVVNGIQDFSHVTFAYIPTGSSNDFARNLKLPSDPEAAVQNILHPTYFRRIDLGRVRFNGQEHLFAGSSGCGFDAAVCHEVQVSPLKKVLNRLHLGKLTYVGIALKQIIMSQRYEADLVLDDGQRFHYRKTFFIACMNSRYEGGGLMLCPQAQPDDGLLDVCVVERLPRLFIAVMLPTAYAGKHTIFPGVHIYRTRKIDLFVKGKHSFHSDGEPEYASDHLELSCVPGILKTIAGAL